MMTWRRALSHPSVTRVGHASRWTCGATRRQAYVALASTAYACSASSTSSLITLSVEGISQRRFMRTPAAMRVRGDVRSALEASRGGGDHLPRLLLLRVIEAEDD